MKTIVMFDRAGAFAENKDIAREIREREILPALALHESIVLDFANVIGATQSFIHALISEAFRKHGIGVLDNISFKNCNETIQKIVTIVSEYMQESV